MNADKQFEKLKYKYEKIVDFICYTKNNYGKTNYISFDSKTKTISKYTTGGESESISLKELKAINKKVEELGWNDER